jgi:hypothetical protein
MPVSSELINYIRNRIHIRKILLYTLFTELCPLRHYGYLFSTQFLLYFMINIKEPWCVKMSWCKFTDRPSVPGTLGLPKIYKNVSSENMTFKLKAKLIIRKKV